MAVSNPEPSALLLDEYFSSADARFLSTLRAFHSPKPLAALVERWKKDHRPWARQQILDYFDQPLNCPGHQVVVKRLFKHAEQQHDDQIMAACVVAFDRLVRRTVRKRYRWDAASRQAFAIEYLATPRDVITPGPRQPRNGKLFKNTTRHYIRRRAWRYFRKMGFKQPDAYVPAIAAALVTYRDEDLARGENVLDSWSLMHACFGKSDVLAFNVRHTLIRPDKSFGDLSAAPMFAPLWQKPSAAPVLLSLVINARCRLVRVWAMQLLRRDHKRSFADITADQLRQLLDHPDDEVQHLGAELLENAAGSGQWPIATWLGLLETRNPTALALIVQSMIKNVSADRLDLAQCVQLACAVALPVARMGLRFLKTRSIASDSDRQTLAWLANARCAAMGAEIAAYALGILGASEAYTVDHAAMFFDSRLKEIRDAAWQWLTPDSPGWKDPALWSRLIETPYDDVRLRFVASLETRLTAKQLRHNQVAAPPRVDASSLAPVWCAVLLGVHRGGRHKLIALRQISDAFRADPARAAELLPVLAAAIRSVRPAEARAGLAAIVAAVDAQPSLAVAVAQYLPELQLAPAGEALP